MSSQDTPPSSTPSLRQRAEDLLQQQTLQSSAQFSAMSPDELRQTLRELCLHKIELELQNEELRRAQLDSEASRTRYFNLYDLAPIGYCTIDADGLILQANRATAALLQSSQAALVGQALSLFIYHEDQDIYYLLRKRLLTETAIRSSELRMLKSSGAPFWARLEALATQDDSGAPLLKLVLSDITDRKHAEALLQDRERLLSLVTNHMPSLVSRVDRDLRYLFVNDRYEQIFGRPREQILGRTMQEVTGPELFRQAQPHLQRVLAGEQVTFENQYQTPDHKTLFGLTHFVPDLDPHHKVIGFFIFGHDITERKQAEAKLQQSESRLREAQAISQLGNFHWDANSNKITWSDELFRIYGYQPGQFEPNLNSYLAAVHPEDRPRVTKTIEGVIKDQSSVNHDYTISLPDGSVRWVHARVLAIKDSEGRFSGLEGTCQDITERKLSQLALQQRDQRLQETRKLESLGVLAGGIAHDFNNLLSSILGNASLIGLEIPSSSPLQEHLEKINQTVERAAGLCRQMLAYSGRGRFVIQQIELGRFLEEAFARLQATISEKAQLSLQLERHLPSTEADASQLQQVLVSLVLNASEALPESGGVIRLSTSLLRADRAYLDSTLGTPDLPEGSYLSLQISDNGRGMSADIQNKIFEPFFTTKFTGRGLGLSAVLGIMRGHKGALRVQSAPGEGSIFTLLFPPSPALPKRPEPPSPTLTQTGRGPILVVDDDDTLRRTVKRILERLGFDAVLASDGKEALALFAADPERFPAVLLDLTMPYMDGVETFHALERLRPEVRVVLMSGYNQQESLERFPEKGPVSFLEKPFTLDALRRVLQETLA